MKETDKSFRIVITIVLVLMGIMFYACSPMREKLKEKGNEVVQMIEEYAKKNGRLPAELHELGAPFHGNNETYEYKDCIFYYEPTKDGEYWLTITFGPDEDFMYCSKRGFWLWSYDTNKIVEHKEELFREVFCDYKPILRFDSLCANIDSINTIYSVAPDSLIYCRQYYEDGRLAAEGWMLEDWDREQDSCDNIGVWKYYTRDGIMVEHEWGMLGKQTNNEK